MGPNWERVRFNDMARRPSGYQPVYLRIRKMGKRRYFGLRLYGIYDHAIHLEDEFQNDTVKSTVRTIYGLFVRANYFTGKIGDLAHGPFGNQNIIVIAFV